MVAAKKSRVTAKKKTPRSRVGKSSLLSSRLSGKSLLIAAALVVVVGTLVVWFAVASSAPQTEPEAWSKTENRVAGIGAQLCPWPPQAHSQSLVAAQK